MMRFLMMVFAFGFLSTPAMAMDYAVDKGVSVVGFSGEHAGNVFEGVFEEWSAELHFDPLALENSGIVAVFDMASAKTGSKMYDGTLPQADWFDVKQYPEARYESSAITANEHGEYTAVGDLTIRGIAQPVSFDFTLSDLAVSPVVAQGAFTLDRLAFDLGKKSDPNSEWVSREIKLELNLSVHPQ